VNISSRHVQRGGLEPPVREALAQFALDPRVLELEITETVLMHNLDAAQQLLLPLKQLGLSISIDDFGTGYSSLAYLGRLPIDTLKIDRSFVRDLGTQPDSEAIAAAIIALAHSLKRGVVAEGVETAVQMSMLYAMGCRLMQGYLFARPQPLEEFERLLRAGPQPQWRAAAAPGMTAPAAAGPTGAFAEALARARHG